MPILADYHIHSGHSVDAEGSITDVVGAALAGGFDEIALTDHLDFVPIDPSSGFFRPEQYLYDIKFAREQFGNKISIKCGIELGIDPDFLEHALPSLDKPFFGDLDFVLGSVHTVAGAFFTGSGYFDKRSPKQAYEEYFLDIVRAVRYLAGKNAIDVVGHLDLIKRYAPKNYRHGWFESVRDMLTDVLKLLIENGVGIEINVSGFAQAPLEQFPVQGVLDIYRDLGGEILTIGSDSHSPAALSRAPRLVRLGQEVARSSGFRYITLFDRRVPRFFAL